MLLNTSKSQEDAKNMLTNFIKSLYQKKETVPELNTPALSVKKKPVRVYIDGAFDLIHSGHYNAIRQAKSLSDVLVLGVNSDEEILKNKGPTILTCKERADILRACKWVDEVHEGTEYTVTLDTLDRFNCQYYAHGDDNIFDSEGNDICALFKKHNRFKMFKRTEGVSTTDIVGKLLSLTRDHHNLNRSRAGSFEKPMTASDYLK